MIRDKIQFYPALLIFLISSVWVITASVAFQYFEWQPLLEPGLLIHGGNIIISVLSIAIVLKSLKFKSIFNALCLNQTIWTYYLTAVIFAVVIWFADFYLQYALFFEDGIKASQALQLDIQRVGLIGVVISSCFLAPVAEEILFRGILLRGMLNKLNPLAAILLSSLIFAAIHFSIEDFLTLFIVSVGYALLTIRSQSIQPAILAHLINNSVTVYYLATLQ